MKEGIRTYRSYASTYRQRKTLIRYQTLVRKTLVLLLLYNCLSCIGFEVQAYSNRVAQFILCLFDKLFIPQLI